MANESYRRAGRVLAEAWLAAKTIDLPTDLLPVDRDEAYASQDEMARLLADDPDNKVVGWKVGATSSGVQEAEGYDGPIPGRVIASTIYKNCSSIPASRCQGAKVEAEIAFLFVTAPRQQSSGFNAGVPRQDSDSSACLRHYKHTVRAYLSRGLGQQAKHAGGHRRQWEWRSGGTWRGGVFAGRSGFDAVAG